MILETLKQQKRQQHQQEKQKTTTLPKRVVILGNVFSGTQNHEKPKTCQFMEMQHKTNNHTNLTAAAKNVRPTFMTKYFYNQIQKS